MVTARQGLDIAIIIYYVPVLFVSGYCTFKHGFTREQGWIFLNLLSLLRLIGGGTGIAAADKPTDVSLVETALITSSIGLSPLLLALLGFTRRVHVGMHPQSPIPPRFLRLLSLPIIVALALGIVGGTDLASSKPSTVNQGHTFQKVAALLYIASLAGIGALVYYTLLFMRRIAPGDKKLIFAGAAAIPFLFVRMIYQIISVFDYKSQDFAFSSTKTTAVIIQAIMSVLMEFIVVALYLVAGVMTPAVPKAHPDSEHYNLAAQPETQQQQYSGRY